MSDSGALHSGYVDAHCHVDLFPDPPALIRRLDERRIHTIAVTNAPSVFEHTERLVTSSRHVLAAVGLHPELVATHGRELERLWPFLERTKYVGEVGLDYTTADHGIRLRQRQVFAAILERCAVYGDKVVTVHSRRAATDVIAAIGPRYPGRVILHWFTGTSRELERAVEAGLYFSINHAMLNSKKGRDLISLMPRQRVLTESDGPFVQADPRAPGPENVQAVVSSLATLWTVTPEEARQVLVRNFLSDRTT